MQLSTAAREIGADVSGPNAWFEGVSTDTRTIKDGELFYALRGENFDGHEHCVDARDNGAVAVVVEQEVDSLLPTLKVADTRLALGRLAGAWRRQFSLPIVGVTGSNGKTTVKEMIASILLVNSSVLATKGNLNNDVGVPQTLFQLDKAHDYAVIEMGASHANEIEWLTEIAQPQIGVITLCAPAHIEGFGSIDNVAKAKGELYAGLAADGTAVINADDDFADYWADVAKYHRLIFFGIEQPADVVAKDVLIAGVGKGVRFQLHLPSSHIEIELPFDGLHNVANALAAAAVAWALDISIGEIKSGLENTSKIGGRLCVLNGLNDARIIDDTYNANPTSLAAAINLLAAENGEKWLVLGDMGELGPNAVEIHTEAGSSARNAGIDRLYAVGELAAHAVTGFGRGAKHYGNVDNLINDLATALHSKVTLLIKGSRVMRMERIVQALTGVSQPC